MKIKKSSNISATALHRFIPQLASGRSSALPCLAAILVWSKFLWEMHLHSLFFRTYEYGKDYIGAPVLGLIVFCICTAAMGILHDYVYEKTETIWLPSLLHGAINAFTVFAYLVKPEYSNMAILGPAFIGIISMIPMIIAAVIVCVKKKRD